MNGTNIQTTPLDLQLTVKPNTTVLPRCLQILSRRGYMLIDMKTEVKSNGDAVLLCHVSGPASWHQSIGGLLLKLTDVKAVTVKEATP